MRCAMLRYSARSGLTFPSVRTSLWKCAALLLPHAIAESTSVVMPADRICKVLELVVEMDY